jgi:uncharacterized protein (TIGR00730 family)
MKTITKKKNGFATKKHVEGISLVRISRILSEFMSGFQFLKKYNKTVSFFGSSRAKPKNRYYQEAFELAYWLSKRGYTIVTGGGDGVMEAANKGAYMAGGKSVGINIDLPHEQRLNKYVKDSISFRYFFTRKVMLTFASQAYIFLPGGFGTLDEFFEITTLIQTKKIKKIPIILIHKDYWKPLLKWVEKTLYTEKHTISKQDMNIYHLVDTHEEAIKLLR